MPKLTCVKGNNKGDEFAIHEGKNIIGRSQDCQVTLFDKRCSRFHCQIIKKGNHFCVQDLKSRNGTWMNGKEINSKAKTCQIGDIIHLGNSKLKLSDKPVGNVVDQAATEVAEELQRGKYGELMTSTTRSLRNHGKEKPTGIKGFIKDLLSKD